MILRNAIRIRALIKKPLFTKVWFLPIWVILGISRLIILTVTFRRLAPYLGHPVGLNAYTSFSTPAQERRAIQVAQTIRLASRYCPWVANCFPQAVTARLILGFFNIPYALYFGLNRGSNNNDYKAHAWVTAGKISVTGGYGFSEYIVVGCYLSKTVHHEDLLDKKSS